MGKTVATNRKARHDYTIEDTIEAGIALTGTEIKSVRESQVNLQDAYARIEKGEAWLRTSEEGRALVQEAHGRYVSELQRLHKEHKSTFCPCEEVPLELN